jgi:DNA-binding response OmpR family regulator
MTSPVVLLVEDDADLRLTTRLVLERQGFTVVTAEDGVDALDRLRDHSVDVAVVDVLMPRMDGLTLLRELRNSAAHAELPVLLLTARDLPSDQVGGLDAGADDYVVKPFDSAVLAARIRVLLRRRGPASAPTWHQLGELRIDRDGMVVERDGQPIELSATEFRLLDALLDHAGQVLSREQLLHLVWGSADWGEPRVVDVNVQRLRAKIGAQKIVTLRGSGYKHVR